MNKIKMTELKERSLTGKEGKNAIIFKKFQYLLIEVQKHDIPDKNTELINIEINLLNNFMGDETEFIKLVKKVQRRIVATLEKELKIVPLNYYRNLWMILGMSIYGLPLGVAFGLAIDNIALLSVGLPFGMAIGIAVGTAMDTKAKKDGRQLGIEVSIY